MRGRCRVVARPTKASGAFQGQRVVASLFFFLPISCSLLYLSSSFSFSFPFPLKCECTADSRPSPSLLQLDAAERELALLSCARRSCRAFCRAHPEQQIADVFLALLPPYSSSCLPTFRPERPPVGTKDPSPSPWRLVCSLSAPLPFRPRLTASARSPSSPVCSLLQLSCRVRRVSTSPAISHQRQLTLHPLAGITGQDGSYLTELLLEKGYEVHGL